MSRLVKICRSVAGALVLSIVCVAGWGQAPASTYASPGVDQIKGPIVEADTVTLAGNVHPLARAEYDRGAVDPGLRLGRMALLLQPSPDRQAAAANLAAAQQNPASPYYRKWLSTADYAARFGASPADAAKVRNWLQSEGFGVEQVLANQRLIYFSGTAAQVSAAFHTELHNYVINGEHHIANVEDPQIPRALAPVVGGIVSLHDFRYKSMLREERLASKPQNTGTGTTGTTTMFPADFGVIYDLTSVWNGGTPNFGLGVTIGIVGRSNIYPSDIATFRSTTHLAANAPTVDLGGTSGGNTDPGLVTGDQDEATLDVEWAGAVAPSATILLAPVASVMDGEVVTTDGVDLSATYLVSTIASKPQIVSVSFGSCEQAMGGTELAFWNTLWQEAALQGQSAFVASGDSGAAGCDAEPATPGVTLGTEAAVNGICSTPYATCVGGTEFSDASYATYWNATDNSSGASAKSYIPEVVWNESALDGGSDLWASGGGISLVYAQPNWQSVATAANGQRGVPDVALTAAQHDGYVGYETPGGSGGTASWYKFSGTSAAAPSFAAIIALVSKQFATAPQGNINPVLYGLAGSSTAHAFHPTIGGDNGVPDVPGYAASNTTYNLATGLGSVDGAHLLSTWVSSTGLTGFAVWAASNSMSIANGAHSNLVLNVTSIDTATPHVTMSYQAPSGVTVAFSSSTVTAGASATTTATVTVGANVQPGNYLMSFTGTAGAITDTYVVALTVTAAPELSLHAVSSNVQVTQGAATGDVLNVVTGGGFSGNVSLTVGTLPTGVTATWSSQTVTPVSNAGTATLTLHASGSATVQTATVTVTATGDGVTATDTLTVQVLQQQSVQVVPTASTMSMSATGSASVGIAVFTIGGLTGTTALTVGAPPSGVTCAFSPSTFSSPGSGASVMTCTGSASVTATSFTATVTATTTASGTFVGTATVAVTITKSTPSITFLANLAKVNLTEGGTTNTVVSFRTGGTFTGNVTLAAVSLTGLGLPAGTTATWLTGAGVTVSGGVATVVPTGGLGMATLQLVAPAATANEVLPTSAIDLTIKATGATLTTTTASETMAVTMLYSPQILVTANVTSLSMASTGTAAVTFTVTPVGGYSPSGITVTQPNNYPANMTEAYTGTFAANGLSMTTSTTNAVTATATINGSNNAVASASRNLSYVFAATNGSVTSSVTMTVPLTVTLAAPTLAVISGTAYSTGSPWTIQQGLSGSDVITVTGAGSFATGSTTTLTLTGLPAGVTANWISNAVTLTPSGSPDVQTSTLTLTVAPGAVIPAGNTTITITPKDNAASAVACTCTALTIPLKLTYALGLLVQPQTAAVTMASAGSSTAEVVKLTAEGTPSVLVPASAPVLTFSGLPSGVTASAGTVTPGAGSTWTSTVTLSGSNTAVATSSPATVTVTATAVDGSGNFYVNTGTFTLALTLSTPTLTIAPAASGGTTSPTVVQGSTGTDTFLITTGGSFNSGVSLAVTNLPTGVTASWGSNPALPSYSGGVGTINDVLTLTAAANATVGASAVPITITATGDGLKASPSATINLTVQYAPAVQVTLAPASATVDSATTGLSGSEGYQVVTVSLKGVGSGVATMGAALSISGLPAGMTGTFSPSTVTSSGISKLTLTGGNAVVPGPYSVTITASQNSGAVTGTATLALQVTQTASALAISPTSATMALAVSGTATQVYTLTGTGSYTGSVTMAVLSGLPAHVTASWSNPNPATMTYNAGTVTSTGASTLTLTADSSAVINSTPVTVTIAATGDGIVQTATISLTITAAAGPSLAVSPQHAAQTVYVPLTEWISLRTTRLR